MWEEVINGIAGVLGLIAAVVSLCRKGIQKDIKKIGKEKVTIEWKVRVVLEKQKRVSEKGRLDE